MALLHEINNGTERFSVASDGSVKVNNAFTFPTVVTTTANYVLTAQTDGSTAWAADSIGMEDWIIAGDTGTTTIEDGDTMTIAGGTNVTTSESAGTVTINSTDQYVGTVTSIATTSPIEGGTITSTGTISHAAQTDTETTSSETLAHDGTFTALTTVTTNATGHVTGHNLKTYTLPSGSTGTVKGTGTATRVAFWSASDTISSNADFYWDNANDRLGIGVGSAPLKKLNVQGTVRIQTNTNYYSDRTYLGDAYTFGAAEAADGVSYTINGAAAATAGNYFRWLTQEGAATPVERMRITSAGDVGIGTTSPDTKLEVDVDDGTAITRTTMSAADGYRGGFEASNTHTGGSIWSMFSTNDSDGYFGGGKFAIGNETMADVDASTPALVVIDGSGYVGIGTDSPSSKLSNSAILNAAASGLGTSLLGLNWEIPAGGSSQGYVASFANTQTAAANYNAGVLIEVGSTDTTTRLLSVESGGVNRFEVRGDGNVGIGTISPGQKLTVTGKIEIENGNWLILRNIDNSNYGSIRGAQDTSNDIAINTNSEAVRIKQNLYVGIGTTAPSSRLTVASPAAYSGSTFRLETLTSPSSYYLEFVPADEGASGITWTINQKTGASTYSDTLKFVQGKVGIGTSSPYSKLDVAAPGTKTNLGVPSNQTITCSGGGGVGEYNQIGFGYTAGDYSPGVIGYVTTNGAVSTLGALIFALRDSTTAIAPTERMRITSGGNVGIGTTGPAEKLSIFGGGSTSSTLEIRGGSTGADNATISTQQSMTFQIGSAGATGRSFGFKKGGLGYSDGTQLASISDAGTFTAVGDVIAYSDKKLKKNIKTLDGSKVYKMRGVSFDRIDTGESSSGVIAQEIQKIAPELISESNETLGVAYGNISGYLIEAIKELKAEIEELKSKPCNCNNCDCKE